MKKLLIAASPLLLAACASTSTPNYDQRFGSAVRNARMQQTLNPNASVNAAAPHGMDGRSAEEALNLHRSTFKTPPPVVNVINIGGPTGGSGR